MIVFEVDSECHDQKNVMIKERYPKLSGTRTYSCGGLWVEVTIKINKNNEMVHCYIILLLFHPNE